MEVQLTGSQDTHLFSPWVGIPRLLFNRFRIRRGLGRVLMICAKHLKRLQMLPARMVDGRVLYLDLREPMCMSYVLTGEIWEEYGETAFIRSMMRNGDVAVDVGANVGWYSTLLSELVGTTGQVHAFEPNERACRILCRSARQYPQLRVVNAALSDKRMDAELYLPADGGCASLRTLPEAVETQGCQVTTLDEFLGESDAPPPTFIKCDVEGAELGVLTGATHVLSSTRPPMWMIEMSVSSASRFGYHPDRLVEFLLSFPHAGYKAYRINSRNGELERLPHPFTFRFNAVFVPAWMEKRLDGFRRTE